MQTKTLNTHSWSITASNTIRGRLGRISPGLASGRIDSKKEHIDVTEDTISDGQNTRSAIQVTAPQSDKTLASIRRRLNFKMKKLVLKIWTAYGIYTRIWINYYFPTEYNHCPDGAIVNGVYSRS